MRQHKNYAVCTRAAWVVALVGSGAAAIAQSLLPNDDGWYAWTVDARGDDQRCCYEWNGSEGRATVCNLDGSDGGQRAQGFTVNPTGTAVIYLKQEQGHIQRSLALSASCEVRTTTPIRHLSDISAERSVAFLGSLLSDSDESADEVLSTIAAHAAKTAQSFILETAQNHAQAKIRGKAWFWLAQTRWSQMEDAAMDALRREPSRSAREGAVFALSQLPGERAADALIEVIESPDLDRIDRKQALFWLAQDESDKSYDYLAEMLR
jgi:uncharacterized protein (DUF1778 family)